MDELASGTASYRQVLASLCLVYLAALAANVSRRPRAGIPQGKHHCNIRAAYERGPGWMTPLSKASGHVGTCCGGPAMPVCRPKRYSGAAEEDDADAK